MKQIVFFALFLLSFPLFSANEEPSIYVMHATPIFPLPRMEIGGLQLAELFQKGDSNKLVSWTIRATLHWAVLGCEPSRAVFNHTTGEYLPIPSIFNKYKVVLPLSALKNSLIGGVDDDLYSLGPLDLPTQDVYIFVPENELSMLRNRFPEWQAAIYGYTPEESGKFEEPYLPNSMIDQLMKLGIPIVLRTYALALMYDPKNPIYDSLDNIMRKDGPASKLGGVLKRDNQKTITWNAGLRGISDINGKKYIHIESFEACPFQNMSSVLLAAQNMPDNPLYNMLDIYLKTTKGIETTLRTELQKSCDSYVFNSHSEDSLGALEFTIKRRDPMATITGLIEMRSRFEQDPRENVQDKFAVFSARVVCDLFYFIYLKKCCTDHAEMKGGLSSEECVQLETSYKEAYLYSAQEGKTSIQRLIYDFF